MARSQNNTLKTLAAALLALCLIAATASTVSVPELRRKLHPDRTERDDRREYWKEVRGTTVTWEGKIYRIRGGFRDTYRIYISVGKPVYGKYNVIITVNDDPRIGKLKAGAVIGFTGRLDTYKWRKPKPVRDEDGKMQRLRQFAVYLEDVTVNYQKGGK